VLAELTVELLAVHEWPEGVRVSHAGARTHRTSMFKVQKIGIVESIGVKSMQCCHAIVLLMMLRIISVAACLFAEQLLYTLQDRVFARVYAGYVSQHASSGRRARGRTVGVVLGRDLE
jgi:hypothetical protein